MGKIIKSFNKNRRLYLSVALLILTNILLRLPSIFEPNRYADEDIYLTIGQTLKKGGTLYRDIHDNKPPAVYYTAALAGSVPSFRLILLITHTGSLLAFLSLCGLVFSKKYIPEISTFIYLIFTTIPLLEGNIANGEIFMIIHEIFAICLFWEIMKSRKQHHPANYLAVGLLFAVGFFYKITAAFDFAAIIFYFVILSQYNITGVIQRIKNFRLWLMVIGFIFPIILTLIYYYAHDAGEYYLRSALMQNIGYLSSYSGGNNSHLILKGLVLAVLSIFLLSQRRRLAKPILMVSSWFIFALFGSLLSGRPYPHYLIQIVAPAVLLLGFLFFKSRKTEKTLIFILIFVTFIAIRSTNFWYYPSLPYYQNFWRYLTGQQTKQQYQYSFAGVERNQKVADFIRNHTLPSDRIFIWGTEPAIYFLSNRLPVGRFTTSYHVRDFDTQTGATFAKLKSAPPKLIVVLDYESDLNNLFSWINTYYYPLERVSDATIFMLNPLR